jgi:hypothetical protein
MELSLSLWMTINLKRIVFFVLFFYLAICETHVMHFFFFFFEENVMHLTKEWMAIELKELFGTYQKFE